MSVTVQAESDAEAEASALWRVQRAFLRVERAGGPAGGGSGASLEEATKTAHPLRRAGFVGLWHLTVYPDVGEAVYYPATRRVTPETQDVGVTAEPDHKRAAEEAARRARAKVRRYAVANRLQYTWTLTYQHQHEDLDRVARDVRNFVRKLERFRGGRRFPWLYVVERHKSGALHVHMLAGFKIRHATLTAAWGLGFTWITWPERRTDNGLVNARKAASYAAKYVEKTFEEFGSGRHRYRAARGYDPVRDDLEVRDERDAVETAAAFFRAPGVVVFSSDTVEDWPGVPVRIAMFPARAPGYGGGLTGLSH